MDMQEYLYNLEQQERASLGILMNTRQMIAQVRGGRAFSREFALSISRVQVYTDAYAALLDHAMLLSRTE